MIEALSIALIVIVVAATALCHSAITDKAVAETECSALRQVRDRLEEESNDLFLKLSENIRVYEDRAVKAAARYHAGTMKYEGHVSAANARWIEAARQNANLVEQLATIRLKHPEAYSESEEHIEDVSPSIPYSVELADWLSKFESPQAREIAMEQADMFRASGLDDEQIIDRLEEEWTA